MNRILSRVVLFSFLFVVFAGQAFGKAPVISSLSPTSGVVGTSITITGSNFGSSQGTSTITFNGVAATPTSWKTGQIVAPVPTNATTGPVVVKVSGTSSNSVTFTVTVVVSTLNPNSGAWGTPVTITGSGFGSSQGSNTVKFNGTTATASSWAAGSIGATVPSGATSGSVVVTVNGVASNGVTFTIPPVLQSISVSPSTSSLALGLSEQFSASGTYSDGSNRDLTSSVTWSSSNTTFATVSSTGLAASHSAGSATITATLGSVNGSSALSVTAPQLISATISPQGPYLPTGANQQFTASGTFSDGSVQDVTGSATWTSSNSSVATVGSSGLATGTGAGTATISAVINGFTFTSSLRVTAAGPPTITASVSPTPNAAGWNDTNVTITFTCVPGSYAIASCPSPETITTEGANQVFSGTVTDTGNNSASTNVTLNMDKTPPALTLDNLTDQEVFTSSGVTASGTLSDSLSGLSSLSCDGTAVTVSANYSCGVTLNPGLNLLVVQATDVAGNIALIKLHLSLNTTWPAPTSLQITPANVSVVVGGTQQFTAVDNLGRARPDATWTVSNSNIATITTDASPVMTGVAVGTVTLTATVQGVATQRQVAIIGSPLSTGSIQWTAPPLPSGYNGDGVFPAVPSDDSPGLYLLDVKNGATGILRGLTEDGEQMWQASVPVEAQVIPDGLGGVIQIAGPTLTVLDGQTGSPVWQYTPQAPLGFSKFSIRQDGSIVALETGTTNLQQTAYLDVFDGNTGQQYLHYLLPEGVAFGTSTNSCAPNQSGSQTLPNNTSLSSPIVDPSGVAHLEFSVMNSVSNDSFSCSNETWTETTNGITSTTVSLLSVGSDNSVSTIPIKSDNSTTTVNRNGIFTINGQQQTGGSSSGAGSTNSGGAVVPDGEGGFLATWTENPVFGAAQAMVTHSSPVSSAVYPLPLSDGPYQFGNGTAEIAINGGGVAFAADTQKVVAFNIDSGQILWTYTAPNQPLINFASNDGGVMITALASSPFSSSQIIALDPSGNATTVATLGLEPSPTFSWDGSWYAAVTVGTQIQNSELVLPPAQWDISYGPMVGGNPSGTAEYIGVAAPVEGVPIWGLSKRGPTCSLGSNKASLTGDALTQYNNEKQALLSSGALTCPSCSTFFNGDQTRATYFSKLTAAVTNQVPYDGNQTNISMYDAGMSDGKVPTDVNIKKLRPVCGLFVPWKGPNGTVRPRGITSLASQITPPPGGSATDVYVNTTPKVYQKYLTQGAILHEALHNLTGLLDFVDKDWRQPYGYVAPYDLKTLLGIEPTPGVDPTPDSTIDITQILVGQACAGSN